MSEGEKILWNAINQIAWGSEDNEPPFRAAPREVLIEVARKAIEEYHHLTRQSNRPSNGCAHRYIIGDMCEFCGEHRSKHIEGG